MKWQESEILEFKESLNELSSEHGRSTDGVAAVVGFANKNGGVIYFGVKNDGTVLGLDVTEKTLREVANTITSATDPPLIAEVRTEDKEGKTVLLVAIAQSDERPHKYKGFGERRGKRYFLAKVYYVQLGEKGDVTKIVGPSTKGIEVTIIDHLKRFDKGTVGDFLDALSISRNNQTLRRRVSRVLDSLVQAGILDYDKKRRWTSYWLKKKA
jgi:hypothetical protein